MDDGHGGLTGLCCCSGRLVRCCNGSKLRCVCLIDASLLQDAALCRDASCRTVSDGLLGGGHKTVGVW